MRGDGEAVPPSAQAALAGQLAAVDSAIAARGRRGTPTPASQVTLRVTSQVAPRVTPRVTPRALTSPVDLDSAPESVLVTLPGVGPALAKRIVQDRARGGPFGSLTAFTRVAGIGEKTAARLAPYVTFSASPRRPP